MDVPCGEHSQAPRLNDELAYNRWAEVESAGVAAHTVPLEDDRVLMLHPAELPAFHPPLIVTCGTKQIQTCLEPTTFDPQGRTLISIHLMLAAEQVRRPTLTLAKLWVELSVLYNRMELPRPKQWYVPGESEIGLCNDGRRGREDRGLCGGRCIPTRLMLRTSRAEML